MIATDRSTWPENGLEAVESCPVCHSLLRTQIYSGLTDNVFHCAPGEWSMYRCSGCACAYLDPRPTSDTLHLAYQEYYTHAALSDAGAGSLTGLARVRRALSNGYCNWRFGTNFQPSSKVGCLVALLPSQRRALNDRFRNLPKAPKGGRLLDVGSGSSAFLEMAKAAGWEVFGADTDPVVVRAAKQRGLQVRQGDITAFADMYDAFDMITLSHVIEHVHDPRGVARQSYRLLKRGGRIWIDTPNINSFGHRRFGRHWRGLEPPRHLVLFTWVSLEQMLREEQFSNIRRSPRRGVYKRLASKSRAIQSNGNPDGGRAVAAKDHLLSALLDLRVGLSADRSEFITLTAMKR